MHSVIGPSRGEGSFKALLATGHQSRAVVTTTDRRILDLYKRPVPSPVINQGGFWSPPTSSHRHLKYGEQNVILGHLTIFRPGVNRRY